MEKLYDVLAVYCDEDINLDDQFSDWLEDNDFKKISYSIGVRTPYLYFVDMFHHKYVCPPPGIPSATLFKNHVITVKEFFRVYKRFTKMYPTNDAIPPTQEEIRKVLTFLTRGIYGKYEGLTFYQKPSERHMTREQRLEQERKKVQEVYEDLIERFKDEPEALEQIEEYRKHDYGYSSWYFLGYCLSMAYM